MKICLRIGVSRCLLGETVRYDGGHKYCPALQLLVADWPAAGGEGVDPEVAWVPVCPEVEGGLGVPRPPIRIVRRGGRLHLQEVEPPHRDHTVALQDAWRARIDALELHGFVCKRGSPSCGLASAPVFEPGGRQVEEGDGLFVRLLRALHPGLPVVDEQALEDEVLRARFRERVIRRARERPARRQGAPDSLAGFAGRVCQRPGFPII